MIEDIQDDWAELSDATEKIKEITKDSGQKFSASEILELAKHFQLTHRLKAIHQDLIAIGEDVDKKLGDIATDASTINSNTNTLSSDIDDVTRAIKNLGGYRG